ncbi:MAG: response regulator [Desulfobacteraceae bacterium]|nr:response regulator [Desulfobacteraceae bacterium]
MKILIAEDDIVSGTLLRKILSKQGHDVDHGRDGLKAWEMYQAGDYRLVVSDWIMPELDGLELCRKIRELNRNDYTYIIMTTGKDAKEDAVAGLEAGADDYIVKPIDKDEFLSRIRAGQRILELQDKYQSASAKLAHTEKIAAIGQLAAGIAHEINNPIGFIRSNLGTLAGYQSDIKEVLTLQGMMMKLITGSITEGVILPDLPKITAAVRDKVKTVDIPYLMDDFQDLVSDCAAGADRIGLIVNELRYFAHPDEKAYYPADLHEIVRHAIEKLEDRLTDRITIMITLEDLPAVECIKNHMEQVFYNLILNAAEAIIDTGQITIDGSLRDATIELTISDTGKGVPEENLSQIFNPFFTTKEIGQGVGLGLTTAQNILKMMGAQFGLHRTSESGTCFKIILPLHQKK